MTAIATDADLPVNSLTFSLEPGAPIGASIDPTSGQFTWEIPSDLAQSKHTIGIRVSDGSDSDVETFDVSVSPDDCAFPVGLSGWTVTESGGTPTGMGTVVSQDCEAVLTEGDSLVTSLLTSFVIPEDATELSFTYSELNFDTTDEDFINDAFEVALIDSFGNPLVSPYTLGRDAFFNISEDVGVATGTGVTVDGTSVTLDISDVLAGETATLIFRLANNDDDTMTSVRIVDFTVPGFGETAPMAVVPNIIETVRTSDNQIGSHRLANSEIVSSPLSIAVSQNQIAIAGSNTESEKRAKVIVDLAFVETATIYDAGVAPPAAESNLTFGDHLVAPVDHHSVAGVGGDGLFDFGDVLNGVYTYTFDLEAQADLTDGIANRGDPGFAMMIWDMGQPFDGVRLYPFPDYSGGPITTTYVAQDVMEYSVWGSKDGDNFVLLSDVLDFEIDGDGPGLPTYTYAGTAPSIVYRGGSAELGLSNVYTREYVFPDKYQYYGIRTSQVSLTIPGGGVDADPEVDAVAGFNIADRPPGSPGTQSGKPVITVSGPERAPSGASIVINGNAVVSSGRATITHVTVNGLPVDAIDAAGNLFTRIDVQPGNNRFEFTAHDTLGQTSGAPLRFLAHRHRRAKLTSVNSPTSPVASAVCMVARRLTTTLIRYLSIWRLAMTAVLVLTCRCW